MKNIRIRYKKKYILYFILFVEIIVYACFYVAGSQGISLLYKKRLQNHALQEQLELRSCENIRLSQEIVLWQQDDFLKEKIAREDLQMAYPGDEVYYMIS